MIRKFILSGLFLAGCVATNESALTKAVLLTKDENLIISAPNGFCVDQKMSKKISDAITLFIVDCISVDSSVGKDFVRRPVSTILTATVIGPMKEELGSLEDLRYFFTTQPGINYLSRSNTNIVFKLHKVEEKNDVLLFMIEQRSSELDYDQSSYFWRAFLFTDDKIISLTASNFSESDYSRNKLKKLIIELSKNIILANKE